MNFISKFRELKKKQNLSTEEIARRIGVSSDVVSQWELGAVSPTIDELETIAACFQVPAEWFLTGKDRTPWYQPLLTPVSFLALVLWLSGPLLFSVHLSCRQTWRTSQMVYEVLNYIPLIALGLFLLDFLWRLYRRWKQS